MGKAKQPVNIEGLEFDALIKESLTYEANIPEYPVEDGFMVQDAIMIKPLVLEMTLFLTNTPVTWANKFKNEVYRLERVLKSLEELYFSRRLCTIITTENTYQNMAISKMTITKSSKLGYAREIPIVFKKVRQTTFSSLSLSDTYLRAGITGVNSGNAVLKTSLLSMEEQGMIVPQEVISKRAGAVFYNLSLKTELF